MIAGPISWSTLFSQTLLNKNPRHVPRKQILREIHKVFKDSRHVLKGHLDFLGAFLVEMKKCGRPSQLRDSIF